MAIIQCMLEGLQTRPVGVLTASSVTARDVDVDHLRRGGPRYVVNACFLINIS